MRLGILVGLKAEARLTRKAFPRAAIAMSGATAAGAERGLQELKAAGVDRLLSFGCAGGLAPDIAVGTIVRPARVFVSGEIIPCDPFPHDFHNWRAFGPDEGDLYHSDVSVTRAAAKHRLWQETGCIAVDMESGVVAREGLPFSVLRVICDTAHQDLPPAISAVMADGGLSVSKFIKSLTREPAQISGLMRLGIHAAQAQRKMASFLRAAEKT